MQKSETIGKLATALSKLQGEIENVHKDKKGYGYMYADLASILEITRPLCAKYELAVSQLCSSMHFDQAQTDKVIIETVLMHSSGEYLSSCLAMPIAGVKGSQAQATGSVISYARRYALAALLGIAQTDNDAPPSKEKEQHQAAQNELDAHAKVYEQLMIMIKENHLEEKVVGWLEYFKVYSLHELPISDLQKLIAKIQESN